MFVIYGSSKSRQVQKDALMSRLTVLPLPHGQVQYHIFIFTNRPEHISAKALMRSGGLFVLRLLHFRQEHTALQGQN